MPEPTATNLKKAEQHKGAIEHAISVSLRLLGDVSGIDPGVEVQARSLQRDRSRLLDQMARGQKQKHVASSTFDGYRKLVTLRLIPALGETMLVDLKRKTVRDWLDTLEVSNKTLSNIQSGLCSARNDATEEELIELNPLAGWLAGRTPARPPPKEDDVDPFSPEEEQAVLDWGDID